MDENFTINEQQVLSDVDSGDENATVFSDSSVEMPLFSSDSSDLSEDDTTDTEAEAETVAVEATVTTNIGTQASPEEISCGVCYKILDMTNCVVTTCGHYHCTTCFFRWIEVNATCSQCRDPIDSKTNLTDEQLGRETEEVYRVYTRLLKDNNKLYKESNKLLCKFSAVQQNTNQMMQRQIRLRQQMDETQGYNEGYLAGAYEFFHHKKSNSNNLVLNKHNTTFMRGFVEGHCVESRRLHRLHNQYKKKKGKKFRKEKTQSSLLDSGFYIEETNPFGKNFTIGLSDDEEESKGGPDDDLTEQFQAMSI